MLYFRGANPMGYNAQIQCQMQESNLNSQFNFLMLNIHMTKSQLCKTFVD